MSKPLTSAAVAKLRPGKVRREIPDAGCPGLYLVIQPSGAKSWALRFRRPDGRPAKLALGTVFAKGKDDKEPDARPVINGHLTLAAAHRLVTELRHEIAQGRDPAAAHLAEKQRRRAAAVEGVDNAFAVAAKDFVERYSKKKVRRWKEQARLLGLAPDDLALIPKGLAERWHDRPVESIDGHDIYGIVDETRRMGAPGLERRSEGETESRARAMHACLSKMFGWLVQHRRIAANPVAGVHSPDAAPARDRVLNDAELASFWATTNTIGEPFGVALKVLLLTGCRLNEVAGMRHDELKEDGAVWIIPGGRTKNRRPHSVPLPGLAQDLLKGIRRIEGSDFAFTTTGRSPISGWSKIKSRLDRAMGDLPSTWRLHDLRRTAATGMAELGIPPHIVEAALNHISGARAGVAGTYNRAAYASEKKAALERWAAHVKGLVTDTHAEIVDLHKARKV